MTMANYGGRRNVAPRPSILPPGSIVQEQSSIVGKPKVVPPGGESDIGTGRAPITPFRPHPITPSDDFPMPDFPGAAPRTVPPNVAPGVNRTPLFMRAPNLRDPVQHELVNQPEEWVDNPGKMMGRGLIGSYLNGPSQMVGDLNDAFAEQSNSNADRASRNANFSMLVNAITGMGGQGNRMTGFQDQASPQGASLPGGGNTAPYRTSISAGAIPQAGIDQAANGIRGLPAAPGSGAMTAGGAIPKFYNPVTQAMPAGALAGTPFASTANTGSLPNAAGGLPGASTQLADNMASMGANASTNFRRTMEPANAKLGLASQQSRAGEGIDLAQLLQGYNSDASQRDLAQRRMLQSLFGMA